MPYPPEYANTRAGWALRELGYVDPPISDRAYGKIHPEARTPNQPMHGATRPAKQIGNRIRKERPLVGVSPSTPLHTRMNVGQQRGKVGRVAAPSRSIVKTGRQARTTKHVSRDAIKTIPAKNRPAHRQVR